MVMLHYRIIYCADKGFTQSFETKLHGTSRSTRIRLLFHPTVAFNVSMPSGAARIKTLLFKMPILIGKYLLLQLSVGTHMTYNEAL